MRKKRQLNSDIRKTGMKTSVRTNETLEACAARRQERSNEYDPWTGPCQLSHCQTAAHALTEPVSPTQMHIYMKLSIFTHYKLMTIHFLSCYTVMVLLRS